MARSAASAASSSSAGAGPPADAPRGWPAGERASLDELRKSRGWPRTEAHGPAQGGAVGQGLVPRVGGAASLGPAPAGHRLDRLDGDVPLGALGQQRLDVAAVARRPAAAWFYGNRTESKSKRSRLRRCIPAMRSSVPGDADEAHEPLVAGPDEGLQRAAGPDRHLPLVGLDQVVQLDQVDPVDPEALERPLEAGPSVVAVAVAGLGGEEEGVAVGGQPRGQAQFGVPVVRRGVEVVDPNSRRTSNTPSAGSDRSVRGRRRRRGPGCSGGRSARMAVLRS